MTGADIQDRLVLSCRGTRVCVSADISASKFPISARTVIPKQEEKTALASDILGVILQAR